MLFLLILAFIVAGVLAMPEVRGWAGEKVTSAGLWHALDEAIYRRIDNLIVPSSNGTTQVDHILVSVYGVFVIETKNMKGWIYGSANEDTWTQVLFKEKHKFQNPLRQNYRHTRCLGEYLGVDHKVFRPIVWFIGDCTFKTVMPSNVLSSGLIPYLKSVTDRCLTGQQVDEIEQVLRALKDNPVASRAEHLQSLEQRYESMTACPRCGAPLRQTTARNGPRAGDDFLACSRFPACRYTRDLAPAEQSRGRGSRNGIV
jgi:restriction system protein